MMIPTREQELAVLRSVIYASLFEYPLTIAQLESSLLGVRADAATIVEWWRSSHLLQSTVEQRDGLFFPAGRCDLIATRARRETLSRQLLDRDRRMLATVSAIPFVRMVALSGSLAHLNAEGAADLDLFVITAPHRVWSVMVALLVIARVLGWRTRLCLNFIVSEQAMAIEPRDLFSANQIIHLRPLSGARVFERFVKANGFVRDFYPNFEIGDRLSAAGARPARWRRCLEAALEIGIAPIAERLSRALYGWHLARKASTWQSRDQVRLEAECLKLHTSSHRASTLRRFDAAMQRAMSGMHDLTEEPPGALCRGPLEQGFGRSILHDPAFVHK
jgi:hypothetical protein